MNRRFTVMLFDSPDPLINLIDANLECVCMRESIMFSLCVIPWRTCFCLISLAKIWNGQCQAGASQEQRKPHPVFVHCVSVSSCSQHNTTRCPLQFIAVFLMCSVGAQNFKALCSVTFFFFLQEPFAQSKGDALLFKTRQLNLFR